MDILPDSRLDPSDVEFIKELIRNKFRFLSRFYDAAHAKMKLLPKDKYDYVPDDAATVKDGYKKAFAQQRSLPILYWKALAALLSITPDDLPSRAAAVETAKTKNEGSTTSDTSEKEADKTADPKSFLYSVHFHLYPEINVADDLDGSLDDYHNTITITPGGSFPFSISCDILITEDKMDVTFAECTKAIEINRNNSAAYNNRGAIKAVKYWFQDALVDFNKAIQLNPQFAEAHNNRGVIQLNLVHFPDALADFNTAIKLKPNNAYAYRNRSWAKDRNNDSVGAMHDLRTAIRMQPNDFTAYVSLGHFKESLNNDGAISDYTTAIELNPKYVHAYMFRARLKAAKGDLDGAFADYSEAIRLDQNNCVAFNNRGAVLARMNHVDDALTDYTKAIELNPDDGVAYYNRGRVMDWVGHRNGATADFVKALKCFESAFDGVEVMCRASLHVRLGNLDEAFEDFSWYIRSGPVGPEEAIEYCNCGIVKKLKNDYKGALFYFNKAIKLNPKCAAAHYNRGSLRYEKTEYDKALADLDTAIRLRPKYGDALRFRCELKEDLATKLKQCGKKRKADALRRSARDDYSRYSDCYGCRIYGHK